MKIIGICASPRKNGNTEILLDQALLGARSKGARTQKVLLGKLRFSPCTECYGCYRTGKCVLKDGMSGLYKKIYQADGVIFASPVFFGSLSAQAKAFIDRFQAAWMAKYVLGKKLSKPKKGVFLCVSASARKDFFENARHITRNYFAVIDAAYSGEVFCPNVEGKGDIKKFRKILEKAYGLGQKIARPGQ